MCTPRGNVARGAGERGCCGVMGDIVGVCLRYVVALFSGAVVVPEQNCTRCKLRQLRCTQPPTTSRRACGGGCTVTGGGCPFCQGKTRPAQRGVRIRHPTEAAPPQHHFTHYVLSTSAATTARCDRQKSASVRRCDMMCMRKETLSDSTVKETLIKGEKNGVLCRAVGGWGGVPDGGVGTCHTSKCARFTRTQTPNHTAAQHLITTITISLVGDGVPRFCHVLFATQTRPPLQHRRDASNARSHRG